MTTAMEKDMSPIPHRDDESYLRKLDREVGDLASEVKGIRHYLQEKFEMILDNTATKVEMVSLESKSQGHESRIKSLESSRTWVVALIIGAVILWVLASTGIVSTGITLHH